MSFARRLELALREASAPTIAAVEFIPDATGQLLVVATYRDGIAEQLFRFDPQLIQFTTAELVGLNRESAGWLKDRKLDAAIGITGS